MKEAFDNWIENLYPWFMEHGIKIIVILLAGFLLHKLVYKFIEKVVRIAVVPDKFISPDAEKKREDTLIRIFSWALGIMIWIMVAMMIMQEFGIPIGPILAGAGIVGLAFGFGGQYLIRDLISGFFIILENQYRIGDSIEINDVSGLVENISLRLTTLRDINGTVHHVPHGEITKVSNLSKDFARVNLDLGISYSSKLDHVIEVVNKVGMEMATDNVWKAMIIQPPQFLRVNEFADSAVMIKILGEVQPLKQWEVSGELRKRIKIAFDREGIEIPFPQMVVHQAK
jgi:small conductance mechanosensitive channel